MPTGGDITGETSQADSGVDVGQPPPQPPDDTQHHHTPSPTRGNVHIIYSFIVTHKGYVLNK